MRTAAALTGDPVIALRTLNRELLARRGAALCSVAAMASPKTRPASSLAVAGHPPPLLVDGDSVTEAAGPGPVLGAFTEETWALETAAVAPGQQLVVVTDGVTEADGEARALGEERLHAQLQGVSSPALAAQQIEVALTSSPAGPSTTTPRSSPSPRPPRYRGRAPSASRKLVARLFEAFNRRDPEEIVALCGDGMELLSGRNRRRRSAAPPRTWVPRACTSTCSTSTAPGTS